MNVSHRHSWALTPDEAIALQKKLRADVVADRRIDIGSVRLVAGV